MEIYLSMSVSKNLKLSIYLSRGIQALCIYNMLIICHRAYLLSSCSVTPPFNYVYVVFIDELLGPPLFLTQEKGLEQSWSFHRCLGGSRRIMQKKGQKGGLKKMRARRLLQKTSDQHSRASPSADDTALTLWWGFRLTVSQKIALLNLNAHLDNWSFLKTCHFEVSRPKKVTKRIWTLCRGKEGIENGELYLTSPQACQQYLCNPRIDCARGNSWILISSLWAQVVCSLPLRPTGPMCEKFANQSDQGCNWRILFFLFHVPFPDLVIMETGEKAIHSAWDPRDKDKKSLQADLCQSRRAGRNSPTCSPLILESGLLPPILRFMQTVKSRFSMF